MGLLLNIETATTVCSVALARDGVLLAIKEQNGDYSHAENITLFIEDVCKQAKISLKDIDAVAVSKGPGSYTGLRIGVSTAKGLCYSLDKPLISVNTLEALADSFWNSGVELQDSDLLCPMLDARRMEVYCAIFDLNGNVVEETAAVIIDENSFSQLLTTNKIYFFGDGAAKCKEVFSKNPNAIFIDNFVCSAKGMITPADAAFENETFEDVAYFEPFYLKDFVAGKKKGE